MALGFTVELTGSKELISMLTRLEGGVLELRSEFENTGQYLMDFETQVFESEGQVFNSPWKELSTPYKYQKARKFPNRGILERTGNMRRGFRFTILNTRAALFHNLLDDDYLHWHQDGSPGGKIPKRVIYKLDAERKKAIFDIFLNGLKKKISEVHA